MAEHADLVRVCSEEWCSHLKTLLLTGKQFEAKYKLQVRSGGRTLLLRVFSNEDAHTAAKKYLDKNKLPPLSIVKAMVEEYQPKKGGRHTDPEVWAHDKASEIACYIAMERLLSLEPSVSQTSAGERIGKLRGRSGPAVVAAWKKLKQSE
jgi:hypothetical protein